MKSATLLVALALCSAVFVAQARPRRELQQAPWDPNAPTPVLTVLPLKSNDTIYATGVVDNRVPVVAPDGTITWLGENRVTEEDGAGNPISVSQSITANYPNKEFDNPEGWRFKTKANASMTIVSKGNVDLFNAATANGKLAPAIAKAGTNAIVNGGGFAVTDALAFGRPGLQYGATVAVADQYIVDTTQDATPTAISTQSGFVDDGILAGVARARAQAGQGETVALARNVMNTNVGGTVSDVRMNANSAKWYMAPGHAIGGAANIQRTGRLYQFTQGRTRSDLGTAQGGVLNWGVSNGVTPWAAKLVPNNIYSEIDNTVNNDAGNAAAGFLNIQKSYGGKVAIRNFPGATASTAVGNAEAGGVTIAYSEGGKAQIGDYDQENDSPENDVAATTRGRGTAEAGQINIALAPNDDAESLGDVKATANQGSAVAGAFTLTNAYGTAEQGVDVNARTSEYQAIAGNVGVSQAQERSVLANSATAKTTTGSALAYNIANAAVSEQNSATTSSDATTTTGQAAGIAVSTSVGGVHSDSQGAASATTSTGNALSLGVGVSGSAFTTRAVSTSAAASKEGQAVSASWSGAASGDATADTASSAATTTGNAASAAQGYGLGVLQGKATVASSSGTEAGSAGSLAVGVSTGVIQAQSKVASSAETKDGRAQSLAGALSAAGVNSIASATSSGASETGDVTSNAQAGAIGVFHGEAAATSSSGTGCVDCISDSVANAVATGVVADALARSAADSDKNPGNALANAIAVGLISRTSNGGSSRIAVGPGQAISGGFAVSAGKKVQDTINAAMDPKAKAASVAAQTAGQKA
ncbi:hypothetical protein HT031_004886 [Scenedesmus sp. PABB004]|nr:hypothetical protein HT031_004886 [Scenedesmus sp. PABB004]